VHNNTSTGATFNLPVDVRRDHLTSGVWRTHPSGRAADPAYIFITCQRNNSEKAGVAGDCMDEYVIGIRFHRLLLVKEAWI